MTPPSLQEVIARVSRPAFLAHVAGRTLPRAEAQRIWLFYRRAYAEAHSLLALERRGVDITDCLVIPPHEHDLLAAFVNCHPEERDMVDDAIAFRLAVVEAINTIRPLELP